MRGGNVLLPVPVLSAPEPVPVAEESLEELPVGLLAAPVPEMGKKWLLKQLAWHAA